MLISIPRGRLRAASLLLSIGTASAPLAAGEMTLHPWPSKKATPQITLTDLDGKQWRLQDLRGKPVVLNFWASWCGPCVQELPVLNDLAQRGKAVVIGVNYKESADVLTGFMREHQFHYVVVRDKSG